jgi:hypothetical protein
LLVVGFGVLVVPPLVEEMPLAEFLLELRFFDRTVALLLTFLWFEMAALLLDRWDVTLALFEYS